LRGDALLAQAQVARLAHGSEVGLVIEERDVSSKMEAFVNAQQMTDGEGLGPASAEHGSCVVSVDDPGLETRLNSLADRLNGPLHLAL
jgi:hypothetical protein